MQVLEIGTVGNKRHPSDILPFLENFRQYFQKLPTSAADMNLKILQIPLTDLECVTNTLVKIGGPIWYLKIKKGMGSSLLLILSIKLTPRCRSK